PTPLKSSMTCSRFSRRATCSPPLPGALRRTSGISPTSSSRMSTRFLIPSTCAIRPSDVTPCCWLMSRLGARWHLIRLAVRSAETDVASRIAHTPAALAIALVLDDVELNAMQLREALDERDIERVVTLLKEIHDAARGLRTELDLSGDQPWGR